MELILYVFAFVFFVVAVFGGTIPRLAPFNLIGAGLACWILASHIIGTITK